MSYHRKEWKLFRDKCIEHAGFKCERCGRKQDSVSLQVHHPHYKDGLKPWQYEVKFCVVLCKGCHAREHGIIKPSSGWILIHSDWEDGEPSGDTNCENCGADMRWHNELYHPKWGSIIVGYDCAAKLGNEDALKVKIESEKMRTFVYSPRWKEISNGYKYKHGDVCVLVIWHQGGYILKISNQWGKIKYKTIEEAKERAFKVISK